MQPRLLFRTHYQVDEPAYMEFLVKLCSSPVQSNYPETIADRLKGEIEQRCGVRFNTAAGRYAVDLAKGLGLLTPNNTWTDKGHLVALVARVADGEEQLSLTPAERLLHFSLFLEADGAVLLFLARYFEEHGSLQHAEAVTTPLVENMLRDVYSEYLSMASDTVDRVNLRMRLEKLRKPYKSKSRQHILDVHLKTLYRVGLLERLEGGPDGVVYRRPSRGAGSGGLTTLLSCVPDLRSLEKTIAANRCLDVAAEALGMHTATPPQPDQCDLARAMRLIGCFYSEVASRGTPICPLATIIEAVRITTLVEWGRMQSYDDTMDMIVAEQKRRPKDVRFHVDRRGRPAFLKLSNEWLDRVRDQPSSL